MNSHMLTSVLALRYRFQWAQVRSRNGRIALFMIGYLFAMMIAGFFVLGGVGAGAAAIHLGKTDLVARIVFGGVFLFGIFTTVIMGLAAADPLPDVVLRRYPMTAVERFVCRHLTAFLDPLWVLCVFGVDAGFTIALCALGSATWWLALPSVVLLAISNYFAARVVAAALAHLLARRVTRVIVIVLGLLIPLALPLVERLADPTSLRGTAQSFSLVAAGLPSSIAATAVTTTDFPSAAVSLGGLIAWSMALVVTLMALERRPLASLSRSGVKATWSHPCDWIAALFGAEMAPMAGKMLRYYVRSPQVRYNFPLTLPLLAVFALTQTHGSDPLAPAMSLLSFAPFVATCTGALSLNVFGFDNTGFRRYFLLPASPSLIVRTAALVALLPGVILTLVGVLAWVLFSPVGRNAPVTIMIACEALAGLLLYNAIGMWTSVLAPRPIPFDTTFGNKLSFLANAVIVGWIAICFILRLVTMDVPAESVLAFWWITPLAALGCAAVFAISIPATGRALMARRERSLALVEGNN